MKTLNKLFFGFLMVILGLVPFVTVFPLIFMKKVKWAFMIKNAPTYIHMLIVASIVISSLALIFQGIMLMRIKNEKIVAMTVEVEEIKNK